MNRSLVEIVVSLAYFLDSSDDTIIDPDASVEMLEYISGRLRELGTEERAEFVRQVEDIAADAESAGEEESVVDFIRAFPELTGLADGEDGDGV